MTGGDGLVISGGGTAVVATDEMLADVESMAAISTGLAAVHSQLAIADATFSEQSRAVTQVVWARASMDDAWTATTVAKDISDYLGGQLVVAIDNYTETERNVEAMALGVDRTLSFAIGAAVGMTPWTGLVGAVIPGLVRDHFANQTDPIGARDIDPTAPLFSDESFVEMVRRFVMTGEDFANGYGGITAQTAAELKNMGFTGVALTSQLLILYAAQAGMLQETSVSVAKTATYERPGPITSTVDRLAAIPDPALRADGAQIRIDEIHDGDTVRYEVFIAGTNDFNPISAAEPFDTTSNVAGVAGGSPASYRAVQLAMEQAGITAESEVSFVGHSQGGLIASMLAASGDYNTRGVTSIGGPSGQIIIPPGVPALLIEHYEDLVPAFGGTQANTDALVVRRHAFSEEYPADTSLPMPAHQLQYYLQTGALIDNAESSVLQDTVDQLNAFSDGDQVISTWYAAERVP